MSYVIKNGSYNDLKVSGINNIQTSLIGKNEPITKRYEALIAYNAILENLLYKAEQEIKRLNEEINQLTRK